MSTVGGFRISGSPSEFPDFRESEEYDERCLSKDFGCDKYLCMARKKKIAPTKEYPLPPAREGTKDLGVDVAESIAHRVKLARYHIDVKCGVAITKRTTVEELLLYALDAFDENPELVFQELFERSAA